MNHEMNVWNYVPWLVRLILMFIPLPGYIHPDEFFQGPEIVAGDLFRLKHIRTWEFDPSSPPVRSIIPPYLICGPPYLLLRLLAPMYPWMVNTYTLLILPKLWILLLSMLLYNAILKHQRLCFKVLATSFVIYTFLDRAFSNTVESALFIVILDFTKSTPRVGLWNWKMIVKIALILTLGTFNRPTFVLFSLVPVLRWLFDGFRTKELHESIYRCTMKTFFLACTCLALSSVFIVVDSVYYHGNIFSSFTPRKIVITPLNFALYNTRSANLARHTLHNRLTHIAVNLPQLLGPGVILYYRDIFTFLRTLHEGRFQQIPYMFLIISFPLFALSVFPHQELRFLTPLIFPALFTYGKKIHSKGFLWRLWVVFNLVSGFMYAFFHQGGIVPSISFLHHNPPSEAHLIYYHTYMPPRHLFVINKRCGTVGFLDRNCTGPKLEVHDLKGASLDTLASTIKDLKTRTNLVFVAAPATISMNLPGEFTLKQSVIFFPHFSMEDPPLGSDLMKCTNGLVVHSECVMDLLSMYLFEISMK